MLPKRSIYVLHVLLKINSHTLPTHQSNIYLSKAFILNRLFFAYCYYEKYIYTHRQVLKIC